MILAAAVASLPAFASASTTDNWIGGTSDWNTPTNWDSGVVPGAGDTVNIVSTLGFSQAVTYDYAGTAVALNSLNLDLTNFLGTASTILAMSANNLNAGSEYIGDSGAGSNGVGVFSQSGGQNNSGVLYLGYNGTDSGNYYLNGTGSLSVSVSENIGDFGNANFIQSDGSNTVTGGSLFVGLQTSSTSTYSLGNTGSLFVRSGEYVGVFGTGNFNQTGGSNATDLLYLGYRGTGSFALSNGFLAINGTSYIGFSGAGTFTQTGGTNTMLGVVIGTTGGSSGTYLLTGGTLGAGSEDVGESGTGTFNQTGGTNAIGGLAVADYVGSTGIYMLSYNGSLAVSGNEDVGYGGTGNFNQTGGTNVVGTNLYVAYNSGSTGTYTLSGTGNLSLGTPGTSSPGDEYVGYGGSTGTYILSGSGSLSTHFEMIGDGGAGVFNQSGGANNSSGGMDLGLGGTTGTYILSGTGSITAASENLGLQGNGVFNQTGGTNSIVGVFGLVVGYFGGSTGSYMLSGTGSLSVSGAEVVAEENVRQPGGACAGTFDQSGGVNVTGSALFIAFNTGSTGSYTLSGGLLAAPNIYVGGSIAAGGGMGIFTISQTGLLSLPGTLKIWNNGRANFDIPNTAIGNLSIVGNGIVNLNGGLTISYGSPANDPISSVISYLQSGYNGGNWTGTSGIISTSAQNQSGPAVSVGYADGNVDSGTAAGPNQIVVKYTLTGDANLDGLVNFNDLVAVIQNFNKAGTDWAGGNFFYGSSTNFADLVAVVQNFNKTLPPPSGSTMLTAGGPGAGLGGTTILQGPAGQIQSTDVQLPEPAMIGWAAVGLLARRRKRPRGGRHLAS